MRERERDEERERERDEERDGTKRKICSTLKLIFVLLLLLL